jgi:hypothetical protein
MYSLVAVSAELAEQLVAIELGGDDSVHQSRTRVRRLRSILGVYRKAFDPEPNQLMRGRLSHLSDLHSKLSPTPRCDRRPVEGYH